MSVKKILLLAFAALAFTAPALAAESDKTLDALPAWDTPHMVVHVEDAPEALSRLGDSFLLDALLDVQPLRGSLVRWLRHFPAESFSLVKGVMYDNEDILSKSEEAELQALAKKYSTKLNVHFVILTANDNSATVLETYSRNFYDKNIAGKGGVADCAMMSFNMSTRRVANDFYGELRTMVSDGEASVIREGYLSDMSGGKYGAAARYFLNEAAKLVERKQVLYNIDVPEVDPADYVYDFSGRLSAEERLDLSARVREISANMGVGHIIVVLDDEADQADQEYLRRFASSFYKRNFKDLVGLFGGFFILAVSPESGAAAVSPFGTYQPVHGKSCL